jgi:hypothetical protein
MTREKTKRSLQEIKELIAGEEDILRPLELYSKVVDEEIKKDVLWFAS